MIITVTGNDHKKKRAFITKVLTDLRKKRPGSSEATLRVDESTTDTLSELLLTSGMFDDKRIIVLDGVTKDPVWRTYLKEVAKDLEASEHAFVVIEDEENVTVKKLIELSYQHKDFSKREVKRGGGNSFALADALLKRDRKLTWQLFTELLLENVVLEELHGTLLWQIRVLKAVSVSKDPVKEAGLKPFVVSKAKNALKQWKEEEIDQTLFELIDMAHGKNRTHLRERLEILLLNV